MLFLAHLPRNTPASETPPRDACDEGQSKVCFRVSCSAGPSAFCSKRSLIVRQSL